MKRISDNKEYMKIYSKERYELLKELKICTRCGKNTAFYGRVFCPECMEIDSLKSAEYRNAMTAEQKQKRNEYAKKRREEHKSKGLCVICNRPAKYGQYCYYHKCQSIRYQEAMRQKRMQNKKPTKYDIKKANGLCLRCGGVIDGKHGLWCAKCAEKQAEAVRKKKNAYWQKQNALLFRKSESGGII